MAFACIFFVRKRVQLPIKIVTLLQVCVNYLCFLIFLYIPPVIQPNVKITNATIANRINAVVTSCFSEQINTIIDAITIKYPINSEINDYLETICFSLENIITKNNLCLNSKHFC